MNPTTEYQVELLHIEKSFNGIKALKDVSISAKAGEIHALLGENGAGKSTLMKILSGAYQKDKGEIRIEGKTVVINSPEDSRKLGIGIIYQEFSLVSDLTVAENIYLNHLGNGRVWLKWKELYKNTNELIAKLGFDINPKMTVGELSVANQQIVEIAKALSREVKVLILDEPTAVLAPTETQKLFEVLCTLKEKGVTIIYISHRLEEIFKIADKITVLKDGTSVKTVDTNQITQDQLIHLMIGRKVETLFEPRKTTLGEEVLRVENLSNQHLFDVSFSMRSGEVLGITGLVGSGRTELLEAIYGASMKSKESKIYVKGRKIKAETPGESVSVGMGFVSEDRKKKGVILNMSIRHNITIANLRSITNAFGFFNSEKEASLANDIIEKLGIRTIDPSNPVANLSGGNQQKVAFAKWLTRTGKLIIIDEPTRGVDIGAKTEIYKIINEFTEKGYGILVVSSEMLEIMGISDRILVMYKGAIQGEVQKENFTEENILRISIGQQAVAI